MKDAQEFNKWLNRLVADAKAMQMQKERQTTTKQKSGVHWAGQQICKLNKRYSNDKQVRKFIREGIKGERIKNDYKVVKKQSTFVLDFLFGSNAK